MFPLPFQSRRSPAAQRRPWKIVVTHLCHIGIALQGTHTRPSDNHERQLSHNLVIMAIVDQDAHKRPNDDHETKCSHICFLIRLSMRTLLGKQMTTMKKAVAYPRLIAIANEDSRKRLSDSHERKLSHIYVLVAIVDEDAHERPSDNCGRKLSHIDASHSFRK